MNDCVFKYPRIERVAKGENIVTYEIKGRDISMDSYNSKFAIPYFDNVMEDAIKASSGLENVILVSDSEPVAVKCAAFLLENEPLIIASRKYGGFEKEENDPYGIYDEFQYEYEPDDSLLKLVTLRDGQAIKEAPINIYLKLLDEVEADAVLYEGFTTNEEISGSSFGR